MTSDNRKMNLSDGDGGGEGLAYKPHAVTDSVHQRGATAEGVKEARERRERRRGVRDLGRLEFSGGEVLFTLPDVFTLAWERLLMVVYTDRALMVKSGESIGIPGTGRGSGGLGALKSETPDIMSVTRHGGGGSSDGMIRSETALVYKRAIERKLRKMGREMRYYVDKMEGDKHAVKPNRKCQGKCKRFGDGEWMYCPWCGGPMAELN